MECIINCIQMYAKAQECGVNDCEQGSMRGRHCLETKTCMKDRLHDQNRPGLATLKEAGITSVPNQLYTSKGALIRDVQARFRDLNGGMKGKGGASPIDVSKSVAKMHKDFSKAPFAVDCRAYAWNNLRAELNKGNSVEKCMPACDQKYGKR